MKKIFHKKLSLFFLSILILFAAAENSFSQYDIRWMSVGSLHNWYSSIGSEIEHGFQKVQQYGLQWPAIYEYQDMQAAKGLWIGCINFKDETGREFPHKVVHVGPRVSGANEFFPMEMKMISRFEPPLVYVDGVQSYEKPVDNDEVDPTMKSDRMIINITNNQLGITTTRKIFQFGQQFNDNYIISDYTFTNTGNVDDDPDIELPNQTLEGIYFFFQFRWAICSQTRYLIGNGTGWGMNTMIDTRGDGVKDDPPDENFRAQFAWHGKFPTFVDYDNIGAPIYDPSGSAGYIGVADSVGRLGSPQYVGVVTLHADKSATDSTDNPSQPSTTTYKGSDKPETSNNDAFNLKMMESEYGWMSEGHMEPRHADKVEPDGDFLHPTGDPALGTPGGFSACNGYGPYTLGPGESIHIVFAEASTGLSREKCIEIGKRWKAGIDDPNDQGPFTMPDGSTTTDEKEFKNAWVYTGRDSLFQTFRRAIDNFNSGYDIVQPPLPPAAFNVNSGGDKISLTWDVIDENDPNLSFEIYRAKGRYDSTYKLIHSAGIDERRYDDIQIERGPSYYYYLVAVGDASGVRLHSSRYYMQTYDPGFLKRPAGENLNDIRVVPNPYNISADPNNLLFPGEANKLAFFNIPGTCTIKIFTEIGELITTLEHNDGTGDEYWNCTTEHKQIVVSGVYIAVIKDNKTGETKIAKFLIIR